MLLRPFIAYSKAIPLFSYLMKNVLIADDHSIVRFGLKQMITAGFAPVAVKDAASFDDVIGLIAQYSFDLLILDINLPGGNTLQMLDSVRLRQPSIKILIFSAFDEKLYAINYLQAGADGYLEKTSAEGEVKNAISTIMRNEKYMSASTRRQLLQKFDAGKRQDPFTELSGRELDVMNLMINGTPVSKIAEMLHLHISTVSTYKSRIFTKLEVDNIVELLERVKLHSIPN